MNINEMTLLEYISGFDNYLINRKGQVYSTYSQMFMKTTISKKGYATVCLRKDNKTYPKLVHRLSYETFRGKIHGSIRHIDGNTLNNDPNNLVDWFQ